jgi:integrase
VDSPKTEASKRAIPVGLVVPKLIKILKQRRNQDKLFAGTMWSENERLISTRYGYPTDRKIINRAIADVCKAAGIDRITSHQLRHTYATRLITSGANPRIAQALLGHENIATTMKIYAEAETRAKESTVKRLSEMTATTALSESVASTLHTLEKA